MATLPTGTVTYLMTDIVGSARLWEANPTGMAEAMRTHDKLGKQIADQHGGHLVKARGEGDSLFFVFDSPEKAIAAAVALVTALRREILPDQIRLELRAAVHSGTSEMRDADYYGPAVNRCARLRSIANPGQVLVSRAARQLLDGSSSSGISLRDLGTHRLKDLLRPENIAEVVHSELSQGSNLLRSLNRVHHNLPVQLTSFIGRQQDVDKVIATLRDHREVTLMGSGGCGKTRLALQVAAEMSDDFPGGVWFLDLTRLPACGNCADFVLEAMHLFRAPSQAAESAIADAFRGDRTLLIFDNCEHVVDGAAALIDALLEATEGLSVLATSREALRIRSEFRFRVPSLSIPPVGADFEGIATCDAVKLFVERASARSPLFALTEKNANSVGELCRLLDGIPLSIEQAASHSSVFTPHQMLKRFRDRLGDLQLNERGVVPRHQTTRATIEWSYGMLNEQERRLLERCSVFAGPWTVETAEQVCADDLLTSSDVAFALESLLAKSLLMQVEGHSDNVRFRMLLTVKDFAASRLGEASGHMRKAHAAYFLMQSEQWVASADWTSVAEEHDDLALAMAWLIYNNPTAALDLVLNIRRYFFASGHLRQARAWLVATMAHADSDTKRATAYNLLGSILFSLGEREEARGAFDQSLFLWKVSGDRAQEAGVLHNQGLLAAADADYETARRLLQSASDLYSELSDQRGFGIALRNLARTHLELGELEECLSSADRAETIFQSIEDIEMAMSAAAVAASAYYVKGDYPRALGTLNKCFIAWSEHVDHGSCILAMAIVSKIAFMSAMPEDARRIAISAQHLNREVGLKLRELESNLFSEVLDSTRQIAVPVLSSDYETCVSESAQLCRTLTKNLA